MRPKHIASRTLVGLFLFAGLLACNTRQTNPKASVNTNCTATVQVSNTFVQFGNVKYGDEAGSSVWIKNIGQCPWVVKKVEVGCGCTQVEFDQTPLQPNDSVQVNIFFNTKGLEGYQVKSIDIFDNSLSGKVELFVAATVI
jgi:hypothetical protein